MLALVKPIPYKGLYQPLPEDDEVGQEMLQHLLAKRQERSFVRARGNCASRPPVPNPLNIYKA
jgi:hypothetical protein